MRKLLKQLAGESLVYGFSGIITSFIGMFLIPVYTRVFQPDDYAVISLLGTTSVLASLFIIFGMDNATAVWYWDKPDESERKKTITTWYFYLSGISILVSLVFIFFSKQFSILILNSEKYKELILLFGCNLLIANHQKLANIWFRSRREPFKAVIYSLSISLLTIGLNILFVLEIEMGLSGIFYAQLIASIVGFLAITIILRHWISVSHFDIERLKRMLSFSLPLIPAGIVFWLMTSAAAYFLNLYVTDKAEIGLYQVAFTISSVLSLAIWAFLQAWPTFALSVSRQPNANFLYSLVFEIYCIGSFFAALVLLLFSKEILIVFTQEEYYDAERVLGLLAINTVLLGMPGVLSIANNLAKKNAPYANAVIIGSLITVLLFNLLIPRYAKEGAAVSMLIGNIIIAVILVFKAQKIYFIPYNFLRIISIVTFEVLFILGLKRFGEDISIRLVGACLLALIVFLIYRILYKSIVQSMKATPILK